MKELLYPLIVLLVTAAAILPATGAPPPTLGLPSSAADWSTAGTPKSAAGRLASQSTPSSPDPTTLIKPRVGSPIIIKSAPYTISAPGYYQLGADLVVDQTSGNIITINASNVILDFAGHTISGPNDPSTTLFGVYAYEQGNLVIRNGTITFCHYAMAVRGNGQSDSLNVNQRIDNILATSCFYVGISLEYSRNSEVTNCLVSSIGSSGSFSSSAYGIEVFAGNGNRAMNNTLTTIAATGSGYAYALSGGSGFYASGNSIADVTTGTGQAYGIYNPQFAVHNVISNALVGINGGKYQDNLTNNCATTVANGADAGGNN